MLFRFRTEFPLKRKNDFGKLAFPPRTRLSGNPSRSTYLVCASTWKYEIFATFLTYAFILPYFFSFGKRFTPVYQNNFLTAGWVQIPRMKREKCPKGKRGRRRRGVSRRIFCKRNSFFRITAFLFSKKGQLLSESVFPSSGIILFRELRLSHAGLS